MEDVSVGKVTIAEIIGVLQACQEDLTAKKSLWSPS